MRDRLNRGVTHEAVDRRAGVGTVLAAGTIGNGHEVGAHAQQLINRVPEGLLQRGLARGHDLERQERGLVVVGAGTGVFVVGEGHDVTLVLRLALTWVRIGAGFGSGVEPKEWRTSASAAHSGTNGPAHATGDVRSCVHAPSMSAFAWVMHKGSTEREFVTASISRRQ